jgi:hypothetical protein
MYRAFESVQHINVSSASVEDHWVRHAIAVTAISHSQLYTDIPYMLPLVRSKDDIYISFNFRRWGLAKASQQKGRFETLD